MAEPFIGEIDLYSFDYQPENWAECKGTVIAISANQALFSLLGNVFGGDGRTSFALPDLRGKMAISAGQHPGSNFDRKVGSIAGTETIQLTSNNLAQHAHGAEFRAGTPAIDFLATTEPGDNASPSAGAFLAEATPQSTSGPDKPERIYKSNPSAASLVALGGFDFSAAHITGGTVTVASTGGNVPFSIIQSTAVLNYSIAQKGIFPSRN